MVAPMVVNMEVALEEEESKLVLVLMVEDARDDLGVKVDDILQVAHVL